MGDLTGAALSIFEYAVGNSPKEQEQEDKWYGDSLRREAKERIDARSAQERNQRKERKERKERERERTPTPPSFHGNEQGERPLEREVSHFSERSVDSYESNESDSQGSYDDSPDRDRTQREPRDGGSVRQRHHFVEVDRRRSRERSRESYGSDESDCQRSDDDSPDRDRDRREPRADGSDHERHLFVEQDPRRSGERSR